MFRIEWNTLTPSAWRSLIEKAGRSNLLQTWPYGEAKAGAQGWQPRRCTIVAGKDIVAICQVLERTLPFGGGIVRINRGPIFLNGEMSGDELRLCFSMVRAALGRAHRRLLLMAPERPSGDGQSRLLRAAGFWPLSRRGWQSAWVGINLDAAALRQSFSRNWRRHLHKAESAVREVKISTEDADFDWFVRAFDAFQRRRRFRGVPAHVLRALRAHQDRKADLVVFSAVAAESRIAAILVCRHGRACTFLAGVNTPAGETRGAHYLLMWSIMREMQRQGCEWFDVGGIDEARTPGVAQFKRGMRGTEYVLAGNCLGF
jgi:hypothetical protein